MASIASSWPCGAHTTVVRSGRISGSTIESSRRRWLGPMRMSTRSATTEMPGSAVPSAVSVARASIVVRRSSTEQRIVRDAW